MSKKSYHVIARSNGDWSVKRTGAERARIYPTKTEAEKVAINTLRRTGGGELIIHGKDGRVIKRNSYAGVSVKSNGNVKNRAGVNARPIKEGAKS